MALFVYFFIYNADRVEDAIWFLMGRTIRDPELKRLHKLMYELGSVKNSASWYERKLEEYRRAYQHRRKVLKTIRKFPKLKDAPEEWVEFFMTEKLT